MRACPFCSGEEIKLIHRIVGNEGRYIAYCRCDHCMATGSNFIGDPELDDIKESALAAWNGEHQ